MFILLGNALLQKPYSGLTRSSPNMNLLKNNMDWTTPFVVYRISEDLKLLPVYYATDLNAARYWLKYIAQPGDVCCRTPKHPKHSTHAGRPEYFSHKDSSGSTADAEGAWREFAKSRSFEGDFPEEAAAVVDG